MRNWLAKKNWLWLLLAGAGLVAACDSVEPGIRIEQAWIRPDPLMENAAGYLVIHNDGSEPDALTGVRVSFSEGAMLHQSVMEGDVHRMEHVDRLELPPGRMVEFRPLSYHVMMMGLQRNLEIGEKATFTLIFDVAGEVRVEAEVRAE